MATLFDFSWNSIDGKLFDIDSLKGKKIMLVNTASECGLTPQFALLEELYQTFKEQDFIILGFPSNDFAGQDPGTNDQIATFCQKNYGVTFPMMEKIVVKGTNQHPIYKWITEVIGEEIKWNFQKVLIDKNGEFVKSIAPQTEPVDSEIIDWITK